jgi:hypothetical protein
MGSVRAATQTLHTHRGVLFALRYPCPYLLRAAKRPCVTCRNHNLPSIFVPMRLEVMPIEVSTTCNPRRTSPCASASSGLSAKGGIDNACSNNNLLMSSLAPGRYWWQLHLHFRLLDVGVWRLHEYFSALPSSGNVLNRKALSREHTGAAPSAESIRGSFCCLLKLGVCGLRDACK